MNPEQAALTVELLQEISNYIQVGLGAVVGIMLACIVWSFFKGAAK